jgi:hypothetical protein
MDFLKKVFDFLSSLFVRVGMISFLKEHMDLALQTVEQIANERSFAPFDEWKTEAFALLKSETNQVKDTWISILLDLAYEQYKANFTK